MPDPTQEMVRQFDKRRRRALFAMAQAVDIDPTKYGRDDVSQLALWNAVSERIQGGVRPGETIPNDPFAVFLTGICQQPHPGEDGLGQGWHKQTAVVKTGHHVDQPEGEKIIAYLKAQDNVRLCEVCLEPITTWQMDNTRMSVFAETQKSTAMPQPIRQAIRGSD